MLGPKSVRQSEYVVSTSEWEETIPDPEHPAEISSDSCLLSTNLIFNLNNRSNFFSNFIFNNSDIYKLPQLALYILKWHSKNDMTVDENYITVYNYNKERFEMNGIQKIETEQNCKTPKRRKNTLIV